MVQAALTPEHLVVTISADEAEQIGMALETVGARYSQAFGSIALCGNFNFDGKLSVAPLQDYEEDTTGDVQIVEGKLTTDEPKLIPRLDVDGDLRLFISRSFFYDLDPEPVSVQVSPEAVIGLASPDLVTHLIPSGGIRLQRSI